MTARQFTLAMYGVTAGFTAFFAAVVIPALIEEPNVVDAFAAGFDNPFAAGYSTDVILCWVALAIWVRYEATNHRIRHGWVCVLLGVVPGVAVGLPLYIVVRHGQVGATDQLDGTA